MRKRIQAVAAAVLLSALAAHAASPEPSPAARAADAADVRQIRGFTVQLNDPNGYKTYVQAIDELAAMGCTAVNFSIAARQKDVKAESIHINYENIPPLEEVVRVMEYAKKKKMFVMFMPIVLLDNAGPKEWRGVIAPTDWDNWFFSYTQYIKKMAQLANRAKVDLFCVGSELLSTESFKARWSSVIDTIKATYKGRLTYSANWDHYTVPTFWDQLDYIGMNNYNELADKPGKSVGELVKAWEPIKKDILAFVKQKNKPFLFTEVGWHNLQNTLAQPWNYVADGPIDPEEQRRAYESFVAAWKDVGTAEFMGAFIWEWKPGTKPTDKGAYSLQGTPSLEIVKKWMRDLR